MSATRHVWPSERVLSRIGGTITVSRDVSTKESRSSGMSTGLLEDCDTGWTVLCDESMDTPEGTPVDVVSMLCHAGCANAASVVEPANRREVGGYA